MTYLEIINKIAEKENVSASEVEKEMKTALRMAGIDCSVEEFLSVTTQAVKERLYIV